MISPKSAWCFCVLVLSTHAIDVVQIAQAQQVPTQNTPTTTTIDNTNNVNINANANPATELLSDTKSPVQQAIIPTANLVSTQASTTSSAMQSASSSLYSSDALASALFGLTTFAIAGAGVRLATQPIEALGDQSPVASVINDMAVSPDDDNDNDGGDAGDDNAEPDHPLPQDDKKKADADATVLAARKSKCGSRFPEHHMQASEISIRPANPQIMNAKGQIVDVESKPLVDTSRKVWSDGSMTPKHLVMSNYSGSASHIPPIPLHFIRSQTHNEPKPSPPWVPPPTRKVKFVNELCPESAKEHRLRGTATSKDCSSGNPWCREVKCKKPGCPAQVTPDSPFQVDGGPVKSEPKRANSKQSSVEWADDPLNAPVWATK